MQAGILYYRVVTRKLQGAGSSIQFILLGGFDSKLTVATSNYFETLSPGHVLQQSEIDAKVASMKHHANAADVRDVTDSTVAKKLAKLWDNGAPSGSAPAGVQLFAAMGIGGYL
jgi:hypothetical protein